MTKKTQGQRLIALLVKRGMTSMELNMTGISDCWWKRVAEQMPEDKELVSWKIKRPGWARALNQYRVQAKYVPKTVWVKLTTK